MRSLSRRELLALGALALPGCRREPPLRHHTPDLKHVQPTSPFRSRAQETSILLAYGRTGHNSVLGEVIFHHLTVSKFEQSLVVTLSVHLRLMPPGPGDVSGAWKKWRNIYGQHNVPTPPLWVMFPRNEKPDSEEYVIKKQLFGEMSDRYVTNYQGKAMFGFSIIEPTLINSAISDEGDLLKDELIFSGKGMEPIAWA